MTASLTPGSSSSPTATPQQTTDRRPVYLSRESCTATAWLTVCAVDCSHYYVQPVCSPTRSTILTGRHVIHSGICASRQPACCTARAFHAASRAGLLAWLCAKPVVCRAPTLVDDPDCGPGNTKAVPTQFTMLPAHLKKLGCKVLRLPLALVLLGLTAAGARLPFSHTSVHDVHTRSACRYHGCRRQMAPWDVLASHSADRLRL